MGIQMPKHIAEKFVSLDELGAILEGSPISLLGVAHISAEPPVLPGLNTNELGGNKMNPEPDDAPVSMPEPEVEPYVSDAPASVPEVEPYFPTFVPEEPYVQTCVPDAAFLCHAFLELDEWLVCWMEIGWVTFTIISGLWFDEK